MSWVAFRRAISILVIVSLPVLFVYQNNANVAARRHDNLVRQCQLWDGIHRILQTGPNEPLVVPDDVSDADPGTLRVAAEILNQEHQRSEAQQRAAAKALGPRPDC